MHTNPLLPLLCIFPSSSSHPYPPPSLHLPAHTKIEAAVSGDPASLMDDACGCDDVWVRREASLNAFGQGDDRWHGVLFVARLLQDLPNLLKDGTCLSRRQTIDNDVSIVHGLLQLRGHLHQIERSRQK